MEKTSLHIFLDGRPSVDTKSDKKIMEHGRLEERYNFLPQDMLWEPEE